ncbi:MAG: phosphate acetyltransferase [Actinobacteria bacterium]|nr:phosphate acetyltransferase [Actinomycetota bacterium]
MSTRVYVAAAEARSGKSAIAMGLVSALARHAGRVGIFRPFVAGSAQPDPVLTLLASRLAQPVDLTAATGITTDRVLADPAAAMTELVGRFHAAASEVETMVIVGSDFSGVPTPTEFSTNATLAAHLDAPMVLVVGAMGLSPEEVARAAEVMVADARAHHAQVLTVIVNRVGADLAAVRAATQAALGEVPVYAVPDEPLLSAPTVRELMTRVDGEFLYGDPERLDVESIGLIVAAMTMPHVLDRLLPSAAVVAPGDREDVLLSLLLADGANTFPSPSALFLNGGFLPSPQVQQLIAGLRPRLPVISCRGGSMATAAALADVAGTLRPDSPRKIEAAERLFAEHVDATALIERLGATANGAITPLMFEQGLITTARAVNRHIVLPEGDDDRILAAGAQILARGAARLTILGNPEQIRARAEHLGLDLTAAQVLSTDTEPHHERYAQEYARLRAAKGVTIDIARDRLLDGAYFGTMMVLMGDADGMVSGANHTTAHTIRPALEVVKTVEGVSVVSSVFFMCLADRVLVYGDCAVNPEPTAEHLADIALSSAATARQFGVEPRVAMLSYSTGASGSGADVEKVRTATQLVKERDPSLLVEGPIQYDAAIDPEVAATKLQGSPVAGQATVFIFPDLNTGNNTYKAVQRSANAVAVGPVLQGLRRPVNDLSRGALVRDIVNTIAITAIQAGGQE